MTEGLLASWPGEGLHLDIGLVGGVFNLGFVAKGGDQRTSGETAKLQLKMSCCYDNCRLSHMTRWVKRPTSELDDSSALILHSWLCLIYWMAVPVLVCLCACVPHPSHNGSDPVVFCWLPPWAALGITVPGLHCTAVDCCTVDHTCTPVYYMYYLVL